MVEQDGKLDLHLGNANGRLAVYPWPAPTPQLAKPLVSTLVTMRQAITVGYDVLLDVVGLKPEQCIKRTSL